MKFGKFFESVRDLSLPIELVDLNTNDIAACTYENMYRLFSCTVVIAYKIKVEELLCVQAAKCENK